MSGVINRCLNFILWATMIISFLGMIMIPWARLSTDAADYNRSLAGYLDDRDRENSYLRRLGNAVNPNGATPVLFVLSTGFLAVIGAQRAVGEAIVDAIQESPQATAAALRSAAKTVKKGGED